MILCLWNRRLQWCIFHETMSTVNDKKDDKSHYLELIYFPLTLTVHNSVPHTRCMLITPCFDMKATNTEAIKQMSCTQTLGYHYTRPCYNILWIMIKSHTASQCAMGSPRASFDTFQILRFWECHIQTPLRSLAARGSLWSPRFLLMNPN